MIKFIYESERVEKGIKSTDGWHELFYIRFLLWCL